ncbi:uncharacterized protein LOC134723548 [Mytilus trossulus]|uniref:uncharacterized protein LOC134723548 n=1 Tax=Mytilus trossulus TaxID=6551 RepID=UPI0030043FC9
MTRKCLRVLNTLFILVYGIACTKVFFKGTNINFGLVQYRNAVDISKQKTMSHCMILCKRNIKCMTFFYNAKTGECVLHSKTFKYNQPELNSGNWKMYLFEVADTRCVSNASGFLYYRSLDLCYNFNAEHYIDYTGHFLPTCASYGAELLRIESQDRQTYVEHILEGRPTTRVAIQGRSESPGFVWTLFDGSPLSYTNWRLPGPLTGDYYVQIFEEDQWTEQRNFNVDKDAIFLCEIR